MENNIKKIVGIIVFSLLLSTNTFAMSEAYERSIYRGCYPDSKQYLGAEKAQQYCICMTKMLSKKYSDNDMDNISKKNEDHQLKAFSFASTHCNNNANAF